MSEYIEVPCVVCQKLHWRLRHAGGTGAKTCSDRCANALRSVATKLRLRKQREKAAA